ncbi:MAG: DNA polymerase IV [Acidobacteria bacterium]|nr:MAG: DNA polymerase IV [Acidobacteriota bacterium]
MGAGRIVLHLDMDAFFAAIEQRDHPELRGRPVIVGHRGRRGVVATCSYEARRFGIRSAMPSVTAERLCPDAVWVRGRHGVYREVSRRVFAMLEEIAPVVERVSIDEAYADLTGVARDFGEAARLAGALRARIRREERLTASAGIAPCRFLAKIASDLDKPDGQVVLTLDRLEELLWPLPVRVIPGVGPKLAERLAGLGIRTVGQLARRTEDELARALGRRTAVFLHRRAHGIDERPIVTGHERKQVSEERTYVDDLHDPEQIRRELRARAEGVARTLRRRGLLGRAVVLKVRDGRYRTVTRTRTLAEPTDLASEIFAVGQELLAGRVDLHGRGVRLLGLGVKDLVSRSHVTPPLFPDEREQRERRIARLADELGERFGRDALRPASLLRPPRRGNPG